MTPGRPTVALHRAPAGAVQAAVHDAMEAASWRRFVSAGADVALKVNLGWDVFLPGAVSAPWVVEGVIRAIRDHVSRIFVVESDQVVADADRALHQTGIDEVCRKYGATWVNMSRGGFVRIEDPSRLVLRSVDLPEILTRTQLITLPVMKTHNKTVITGAIKNQWGCLRTLRHNFHPVLPQALVDVNTLVRPRFAVMDGTIGLEGDGPKSGTPKEMGLVLASADPVALDAVAARVMGFDPGLIGHLQMAAAHGLGVADVDGIDVVGESLAAATRPFRPAHHNAVSWFEMVLRRSLFRRLVFQTPAFHLFCWGARRYYDTWELTVGRRLRAAVLRDSPYRAQWPM